MSNFNYKNLLHNPTLGVIEHSEKNGQVHIIATSFKIRNNEILIDASYSAETISELSSIITHKAGVHLLITNTHVLTKEIETADNDNQVIVSQGYPNLNLDAFYYEILKTTNKAFITLCRKQYINELITQYQAHNVRISQLSLGGLNVHTLPAYTDLNPVRSSNYLASFDEHNKLQSLENSDYEDNIEYRIDNNIVSSQHILALATVLGKFSSTVLSGNLNFLNLELDTQYKKAKLFKKIAYGGIGMLLLLLFVNFIAFNAEYKEKQKLLIELETHKDQTEELKEYQDLIASKEAIVNSIIASGFSKSSFYINQVLVDLPTSITLTDFSYQPISKNINAQKPIRIDRHRINIKGESIDKQDFSDWLTTIDECSFIDFITIVSYGQVKNNRSDFEINISLHTNDSAK
ncbi:hypothetical protein ACE939_10950 [Aquimarina sp. W85]|uniref:hypothetical protein n=1 Tax=Aquimarina rhodophyticola TaxID=3342246 RepID=UPI003670CEB6